MFLLKISVTLAKKVYQYTDEGERIEREIKVVIISIAL